METFRTWAMTPPLGWNSWDCYGAGITEKELLENADFMASHLKQYGWEYVVCDIQWYEPLSVGRGHHYNKFTPLTMDAYGRLTPAENRFPSAAGGKDFRPIADYIHSLGLKFGLHMMRGVPRQAAAKACPVLECDKTCRDVAHPFSVCPWNTDMYGLLPGEASQKYYDSVIALYASWGVDYIKCDDICVTEFRKWDDPYNAPHEIEMLRSAIDRCGRAIVLSLSPGPAQRDKAAHLRKNANLWRMTGDFWDDWDKLHDMFDKCLLWQGVGEKGVWPDCDMLPVGALIETHDDDPPIHRFTRFTHDEQITMMTLWGIFRSPLMIGGDLPQCDDFTLSLLTNEEYMRMHRESSGAKQIFRRETNGKGTIVWASNGKGCKYVAVFNTSDKPRTVRVDLRDVLLPDTEYAVRDVWSKKDVGKVQNALTSDVAGHGAMLFLVHSLY